jgi:hypothetical protein
MKITKNKAKITSVITAILLIASAALMTTPAQGQTTYTNLREGGSIPGPVQAGVIPDVVEATRAFLSFSPNPIGLSQALLVNVWMNPALHVSRYFTDYAITFTKPDGTKETIKKNSYRADTTAWLEYTPDQTGEWKIKFEFPGGTHPKLHSLRGSLPGAQT